MKAHQRSGCKNTPGSCKGKKHQKKTQNQFRKFWKASTGWRSLESRNSRELASASCAQLTQNPGPKNSTAREKKSALFMPFSEEGTKKGRRRPEPTRESSPSWQPDPNPKSDGAVTEKKTPSVGKMFTHEW